MFKLLNQRKLSQIVFSLIALMSLLITLRLISDNNINYFQLKQKPRIFCLITTREENHYNKAIHVKNTWAKRCDQFLFLSSVNDSTLPSIKVCEIDDRSHIWCKV